MDEKVEHREALWRDLRGTSELLNARIPVAVREGLLWFPWQRRVTLLGHTSVMTR